MSDKVCEYCGDVMMFCKCYEEYLDKNRERLKSENTLNDLREDIKEKTALHTALALAINHHEGQMDKAGKPYIEHPLRLMDQMESEEEKIVAVLHDIVEDTDISLDDLRNEGFSEEVLSAIECVTIKDGEDYDSFIERISFNPLAVKVKLADLEDNMDLTRLPEVTDKDFERVSKYKRAKERLMRSSTN